MTNYIPRDPDNASIKATLEEIRKSNRSATFYNKLIIAVAIATLAVSIAGVVITIWK